MPPTRSGRRSSAETRRDDGLTDADSRMRTADQLAYWQRISADDNGMLGGFPQVSRVDLRVSRNFLRKLSRTPNSSSSGSRSEYPFRYCLEPGAGIGRVTLNLLAPLCENIDIVEPIEKFTAVLTAADSPLVKSGQLRRVYNVPLQDWTPHSTPSYQAPPAKRGRSSELKKFRCLNKDYMPDLKSELMVDRQKATAVYLIDHCATALRLGNVEREGEGEDEAETVCRLKYENITLRDPSTVIFDFTGNDGVRVHQGIDVDPQVFKNLKIFKKSPKRDGDDIFDRLAATGEDDGRPSGGDFEGSYDLIYNQWCLNHLPMPDLVRYFSSLIPLLAPGGWIIVKENLSTAADGADLFDEEDSSVTRSDNNWRLSFEKAGLRLVRTELQTGFLKEWGLLPVRMYALRPGEA
ncbi:AdoMet dependent proline di-methyltransferase-domain-containing protein [Exophiala viscosa]|uniref:Alpha N-terminal protein methyltransferase 1 n=1 Tax=Exophiala viscosa TaxID=2486360 RepID=A0AAN6DYW9_9EURO|nr:AdoMet dependent proline di-methyltransferase-domain-containing protein [Exophiala viscosa]KAI1623938.1 AdoMet dependent proline di-methyltransferase-domain-containing protein [Exophiala viscosa]